MIYDKILGRLRDADNETDGSGSGLTLEQIQELIANSTINWSQIIGSPTTNTELKQYIDNLLDLIALNQFNALELVTQEMKDYFANLLQNLTITTDQITDLDSINQEFKTYIDGQITALTNYINDLVLGDVYTAELKQYIDNAISNLQTVLEALIQTTVNTEVEQYIEQIINNTGEATRLISGSVTWMQNLDFLVSPLVYQILNQRAESPETLITIPANAENNPRFAVIYADIFGNVGYILGVAAPSPAVPIIDDATQIHLTTVYIAALGTTPSPDPDGTTDTILNTVIYDEGTEWTPAKIEEAGVTIDLIDASEPAHGAKAVKMVIVGGAAAAVPYNLVISDAISTPTVQTLDYTAPDTDFVIQIAELYPDHKTDNTIAGIRHLIYERVQSKNSITAYFINQNTGVQIPLRVKSFAGLDYSVPELNFSAPATDTITLTNHLNELQAGNYLLVITGVRRYDQQFTITAASNLTPVAAQMSFTAAAPVVAKGGNISLSLKPSAAWLSNTGLIIDLYNGAVKVGSLPIVRGFLRGFNPDIFDYQRITIPVADFNPTADQITALVIRPVNAWPNGYFLIDNIVLQTGITAAADRIEDMTFEYRDVTEAGQIYTIDPAASFGYRVKEIVLKTDTGNVSAKLKFNAVDITGLSAIAATDTNQTIKATALNNSANNDVLTLEILDVTNGATALIGKVRYIRN